MEYGIPSGGALCMELLQQMRRPSTSTSASNPSTNTRLLISHSLISRVQTIQTLSLFISCLDWVSSELLGMSKFYDRMCNIIKRILERVLTPLAIDTSSASVPLQPQTEERQNSAAIGDGIAGFGELDAENIGIGVDVGLEDILDWPDFPDWNQESWMEVLEGSNFL